MATPTYTALATVTLASSASDITFSSISGYRDLVLVATGISTSGVQDQGINFNGDGTDTNYNCVIMWGNGGTYNSTTSTWLIDYYGSVTTDNTAATILQIMDAGASDKHTTYLSRSNRAASGVDAIAGRWSNTAAVTSIKYFLIGGTLAAGTTVSLYGIEA